MSMTRSYLIQELKSVLMDAAAKFADDYAFERHLDIAALEMGRVRQRTLVGQITLVADQPSYAAPEDLVEVKYPLWGMKEQRSRAVWAENHPGRLPRLTRATLNGARVLWLSPSPSAAQIADLGATYQFFYFAGHRVSDVETETTVHANDRHLLIIRAVAQGLLELALNGVSKPVSLGGSMAVSTAQFLGTSPGEMSRKLIEMWEQMAR